MLRVLLAACLLGPLSGLAHPIPDVPVRSFFEADGSVRLVVEVDTRCFSDDPENEPYLFHRELQELDDGARRAHFASAASFVRDSIDFFLEPEGRVDPEFEWRFTTHAGEALEAGDDPVMVTGTWTSTLQVSEEAAYHIRAHPEKGKGLSVLFLNHKNDRAVPRMQVLFPGEESYRLDLSDLRERAAEE